MVETTGCDAVMIGRSAIGNPWVFEEIKAAIGGRSYAPPTPRGRVDGLLRHARLAVQYYGEPAGLVGARRIMAAYLKRLPNVREVRSRIMSCTRLEALEEILRGYTDRCPTRCRSRAIQSSRRVEVPEPGTCIDVVGGVGLTS
jgi:tRNA-dihydrouridine synthase